MTTKVRQDHPMSEEFHVVELPEWGAVGPAENPKLKGLSFDDNPAARMMAQNLRGRVDIREGREGIEISSSSFVGQIEVGSLRISIRPKLPDMPLTCLLRYAYGLRDVSVIDLASAPTSRHGLSDLLISLLASEVEELLHRGLARQYVPLVEDLESPRGRILIDQIVRSGGLRDARLPCRHFERRIDWHLNQVVCAGLVNAGRLTDDSELRRRLRQSASIFGDVDQHLSLSADVIDRAERCLTRLTQAYQPSLKIIRLLQEAMGIAFQPSGSASRTPGFLFDMNIFFQRLLLRFLRDNLSAGRVEDELPIKNLFSYALNANPKRRQVPKPRPDYALFVESKLDSFLDAKYRDIWENGYPAEWLYQLSIYSLASPQNVSILLYASMSVEARDERVEIRPPFIRRESDSVSVIFRPVPLNELAQLLDLDRTLQSLLQRRQLAAKLVSR
jgi:5-methylcytosine-specific restriction enzyme subunit McrC